MLFLLFAPMVWAQGNYRPGDVVPKPFLKVYGYECFFSVSPISEQLRSLMDSCSMHQKGRISWDDLRYLQILHCDAEGNSIVGEMVCAASISNDLLEIFKALYVAAYPIEKMRLIDYYHGDDEASMRDNNSSCFNQRSITAGGKASKHSYGLAVDINPKYNPYYKKKGVSKVIVRPEGSSDYLNREEAFPYKIVRGDLCYRLFKQHGFQWGGSWLSGKDYQHFEKPAPRPQTYRNNPPAGHRQSLPDPPNPIPQN